MLDPSDYSYLSVHIDGAIAFATRDRPANRNRHSREEGAEYPRFLREVSETAAIRVAVVTGAGSEWFCAGEDAADRLADADHTAEVGTGRDPNATPFDPGRLPDGALARALAGDSEILQPLRMNKPVITALNGSVTGVALTSVLLSDIVIAEEHVRLRDMHVTAGVVSATGPMLWPLSTGVLRAKRWLLTGDWITALEAERDGLVTEVIETGRSLTRATEYAEHLAALSPEAVSLTKRAINNWLIAHVSDVFAPAFAAEISLLSGPRNAR